MRNRTQAEIYSALACVLFLRLSGGTVWSQTNPASPPPDPTSAARESRSQETLLSSQQAQEQHAQLLRAVDLIRRDAAVNFQTYTAGMERIRKDTELNL